MTRLLNRFKALRIRRKLALMMLFCSSVAICLGAVSFLAVEYLHSRSAMERDFTILTDITGTICAAPIMFNDAKAAVEVLDTLKHHPQIIHAAIVTKDGAQLATYHSQHAGGTPSASVPLHEESVNSPGSIRISRPVIVKNEAIGSISITVSLSEFKSRMLRYVGIVLLLALAIIAICVKLANYLGGVIAAPVLHLEETARMVAVNNDYSLRVSPEGDDEIASLASQFNAMLVLIEQRDQFLEKKRAELVLELEQRTRELNASYDEILKNRKLESIGVLAGGIAHDFNNFLMAIMGNISMAVELCNCRTKERLQAAMKAAERAKGLTKQLLTFSRGGSPVRGAVDLGRILPEAGALALAGSSIRTVYDIPQDLPAVWADEGQLVQVVSNLLVNARQAMPDGGTITVAAWSSADRECAFACNKEAGETVCFSVTDEGHGIPQEHLASVFDPYFTTKASGSGLGLATVYSIVHRHDGNITVSSEPGAGTTFTICLPVAGQELTQNRTVTPECSGSQVCKRILLMDDEPIVRDSVSTMLVSLGCSVVCAADGEEMLKAYREALAGGSRFDMVLVDLTIPGGMGGEEAVQRLLELDPAATAIVSSGYATNPVMANYRTYGFKGVLEKPYTLGDLEKLLRMLSLPG